MSTDSQQGGFGCRKARSKLALLAGGELTGDPRRAVEQHLIACPDCRARLASCQNSVGILRAAGARVAEQGQEPPSLWPALRDQIVEAKHAPKPSRLAALAPWLDAALVAIRPRWIATAMILGLIAAGVTLWADRRADLALVEMAEAQGPLPTDATDRRLPPPPDAGPAVTEADLTTPALPLADANASRFHYDLDRGTPMGPNSQDSGTGAY